MTTCWPQCFDSCSASTRATESVGPPAASGTIMRTARLGHASAFATRITFGANTDAVENASSRRRVSTALPRFIRIKISRDHLLVPRRGLRHADQGDIVRRAALEDKPTQIRVFGEVADVLV